MQTTRFTRIAAALALATAAAAHAAEGMWTLDNLPRAQMKQRYGFEPDADWVGRVMRSSALLGGCSASFVSPDGLVMTNHHCVTRCIAQLSSTGNDLMANGFVAGKREDELRCPEVEVSRLESMTDVTERVRAATAGKSGAAFQAAEDAVRAQLTRECRGAAGEADRERVRCDLVVLYRGAEYQLYKYRRYSDVRLAFVPEESVGAFGGDPDNFNFPRWCLDMALLRVYEGGKPAAIAEHFRFQPAGAQPGEMVFIPGHPGSTQRLLTVSQLETVRDQLALYTVPGSSELRGLLLQIARGDAEARRQAMASLQGVENGLKVQRGQLQALMSPALMDGKRAAERALKAFVDARPELKARVGDPWADIERAQRVKRELEPEYAQIAEGRAFGQAHFAYARTLLRGAVERSKPDGQRLREFAESMLPRTEQRLRARAPVNPAFAQAQLAWSLNRMRSQLGADDPTVRAVLGARSPEDVAAELVRGSKLADPAERMRLWNGGAAAVDASDDPFIKLARLVEPRALALRQRYESEVAAVEREAAARLATAVFAQSGRNTYPDATGTLRLSYGEVRGWTERGREVAPFTDTAGLFARATGSAPFALPARWLAAKDKLNPAQRYNFVTDHDIIGGNSGSPVINRAGQIVGLAFDGNIHSLGGSFSYDPQVNRTVAVHPGAMLEALSVVYRADHLVAELAGAP